ncbi:hypothetical protein PMAYCL1PPCAC_05574 [Pristionchus mayeri]|uniref:Uncharacterized protein n=1 Tax=Pristionchus mayeri TaxID=1317129 RepID=A0AAN4ZCS9_9BILA|nr:hypothetical protein PMAYCL1PPCAC_05574 [Pristionchus mayeri]
MLQDDVPSNDERPDFSTANVRVVTKIPAPIMCPTPIIVMSKVLRHRRRLPIDKKSMRASTSKVIPMIATRIVKVIVALRGPGVDSRPPSEDETVVSHCVY